MRLSEKRIRALAKKMGAEMLRNGGVKSGAGAEDLAALIAKILMQDQRAEIEIEEEARAMLERQKSLPPPGTGEYQGAFQQAKRNIAARKGFVL